MESFRLTTIILTALVVNENFVVVRGSSSVTGCFIPVAELNDSSPLILRHTPRKGESPFHMPTSGILRFRKGESVRLGCPEKGSNSLVIPGTEYRPYEVVAQCTQGAHFKIRNYPHLFFDLRCARPPQSKILEEGSCDIGHQGKKYNIGFQLNPRKFFGIIEICYDTRNQSTLHARYRLSKTVPSLEGNRLSASAHHTDAYVCKAQVKQLSGILGSAAQARRFVSCDYGRSQYLVRRRLVPAADFVLGHQKAATAWHINTAPQWESIGGGNWAALEDSVRRFANRKAADLTVVTGTLYVASLPDAGGVERKLYLDRDKKGRLLAPVPALYWKLVLDPARDAGIVFVAVNDPHHSQRDALQLGLVVCTDVCGNSPAWFAGWNRRDPARGFVYCCSVGDFQRRTAMNPFPYSAKYLLG